MFEWCFNFYFNTKAPTIVLKICVKTEERFNCFVLSSQKLLYKTAYSTALVTGLGLVVVDSLQSVFGVVYILKKYFCFFVSTSSPKTA